MHTRRIAGHDIALIERDGAGPPIVFLHGSGLSARIWAPWIDRLTDRRCVAPDLLGYGRSERLPVPLDKDWRDDLAVARADARLATFGRAESVGLCTPCSSDATAEA